MLIEASLYIFGVFAVVLSNSSKVISSTLVLIAVCFLYILSASFSDPQVDMQVYYRRMLEFRPYMASEFLYYGMTFYLYKIFGNQSVVVSIINIAMLVLVYSKINRCLGRRYTVLFLALIVFSFVGVLGAQNVYRQFLASLFLLISYSHIVNKEDVRGSFYFLIALFIHNASLIFFPVLAAIFIARMFRQKALVYFVCYICVSVVLYVYFQADVQFKSSVDTGGNYLGLYWFLCFSLLGVFSSLKLCRIRRIVPATLFLVICLPMFFFSQGSTGGERVFMLLFPVILFEYFCGVHLIKVRRVVLHYAVIGVFCVPTMLFFSSRQFLL